MMDPTSAVATRAAGRLVSRSPHHTLQIGRALGTVARAGTTFALTGPLGAGKTQLAKGIAVGLGVETVVNSPTFILMNEHVGRLPLFHVDAYRLDHPEEAMAAGLLDERQAAGVTVIEWAERLGAWLPADRLEIRIEADHDSSPERRALHWRTHGRVDESVVLPLRDGSLA